MKYEDIRNQIKDGDIIFVGMIKGDWMHKVVRFVTKSEYVHAGIAFWMKSENGTDRLFIVEAHGGGRRIVSLSSYSSRRILVVGNEMVPWSKIEPVALDKTGVVPYGYLDYIEVGLHELFGCKIRDYRGEICSEAVAKIIKEAGYSDMRDVVVSPGQLLRDLVSATGFTIKCETDPT